MNRDRFTVTKAPPVRRVGQPPELTGAHPQPPVTWYAERALPSPPPALACYRSEVFFIPVPDILNEPAPFTLARRVETVRAVRFYFNADEGDFANVNAAPAPYNAAPFRLVQQPEVTGFVFSLADEAAVTYVQNVPVKRAAASRDLMPLGSYLVKPMPTLLSSCSVTLTEPGFANLGITWVVVCELFYTA